jgi:hypothetical protein
MLHLGTREFRVDLDERLEVSLRDEQGTRKTQFPTRRKSDDALQYETSKAQWQRIRSDGASELRHQAKRLEMAMVDGRHWTPHSFTRAIVAHPLTGILARRVVWRAAGDRAGTGREEDAPTFRVAEDGSLANERDDPYSLPQNASVEIPHPMTLGSRLGRWAEVFGDYEIVQPFEQLGRQFYSDDDSRARLTPVTDWTLSPKAPFILENLGWSQGDYTRGGWTAFKTLRGIELQITLYGAGFSNERTGFSIMKAQPGANYGRNDLVELDAIARSEVLRDLVKSGLKA